MTANRGAPKLSVWILVSRVLTVPMVYLNTQTDYRCDLQAQADKNLTVCTILTCLNTRLIPPWRFMDPFLFYIPIRKLAQTICRSTHHLCSYFVLFRPKNSVGVFWNNAAETWVDIKNSKDTNVVSSLVNLVSGNKVDNQIDVHFMSESGVFDLFVFMGPSIRDAVKQYAAITGPAPLPQVNNLKFNQQLII